MIKSKHLKSAEGPKPCSLTVYNLTKQLKKEDIYQAFRLYGQCEVMEYKEGQAIITFLNLSEAEIAVSKLNKTQLGRTIIDVKIKAKGTNSLSNATDVIIPPTTVTLTANTEMLVNKPKPKANVSYCTAETIVKLTSISKHRQMATILGWNVAVRKGIFNVGDVCIYVPVDMLVDTTKPYFAHLANKVIAKDSIWAKVEDEEVTITSTGEKMWSQGIAVPLPFFHIDEMIGAKKYKKDMTDQSYHETPLSTTTTTAAVAVITNSVVSTIGAMGSNYDVAIPDSITTAAVAAAKLKSTTNTAILPKSKSTGTNTVAIAAAPVSITTTTKTATMSKKKSTKNVGTNTTITASTVDSDIAATNRSTVATANNTLATANSSPVNIAKSTGATNNVVVATTKSTLLTKKVVPITSDGIILRQLIGKPEFQDHVDFPLHLIAKTDEPPLKKHTTCLLELQGLDVYITKIVDGSSLTMILDSSGVFTVCSRNRVLDIGSVYYQYIQWTGLEQRMRELGIPLAIQCELCGPTMNGNRMKLSHLQLYLFTAKQLPMNATVLQQLKVSTNTTTTTTVDTNTSVVDNSTSATTTSTTDAVAVALTKKSKKRSWYKHGKRNKNKENNNQNKEDNNTMNSTSDIVTTSTIITNREDTESMHSEKDETHHHHHHIPHETEVMQEEEEDATCYYGLQQLQQLAIQLDVKMVPVIAQYTPLPAHITIDQLQNLANLQVYTEGSEVDGDDINNHNQNQNKLLEVAQQKQNQEDDTTTTAIQAANASSLPAAAVATTTAAETVSVQAEGIVIRPIVPVWSKKLRTMLSVKIISNGYKD